jgi:serine/threonine-protein kinase
MKRIFIKVGILLVFFVLLLGLSSITFFKVWEKQTIDLRFFVRGETKPSEDIVIIGIDDNSIESIGNWPWERSIHGRFLEVLKKENPKLVVFDILFDTKTDKDAIFAKSLKSFKKVVLSNYLYTYFDKRLNISLLSLKEPVDVLKEASLATGFSNVLIDDDNKVRRARPFEVNETGVKYYSLPLVVYGIVRNEFPYKYVYKFSDFFYINFRGGEGTFRYFSYVDVLNGRFTPNTFKNKIIFVGAVSPILKDTFLHPFSGYVSPSGKSYSYMPGVEIHANILDNLLNNDYLKTLISPLILIINFLSVFFTGIFLNKKMFLNVFITIFLILLYFGFSYYLFLKHIIAPVVSPSLGMVFGFLGNLIYQSVLPRERLEGITIKRRYKILKKLGSGGMASVYLAKDLVTKKDVAVKILHPQYAEDKEVLERFYREIQVCKDLDHPNIVKVLDHGKEDDYVFMVMEYVSGKDLKKIIEEKGPIPVDWAVEIIKQVAYALSYANSKNIVHRDIKPQNIMITNDGKVKLMDFGIARIGGLSTLTQTGVFMGTPQYASPEQLEGKKVDIRSDIFSLGIVFYEMLTGLLPYAEETTISLMLKRYQEELPDVRSINSNIPEGIAMIVKKMTARFPEFRYQTPEELIDDLNRGYPLHPYEEKNIASSDTIIKRDIDKKDN